MSEVEVDERAFAEQAERCRRELRVHCYRLLGSVQEAEDLVQETFLRAWRRRDTYEGRSTFRAWLYKIATNACLDVLDRRPPLPVAEPDASPVSVPWLTPCPATMLDDLVVSRETIELAFLTAVQHLPARQRAALVLRDVLGWSAKETAELLDSTVASANSALQRARETMRTLLPARRSEWTAPAGPESSRSCTGTWRHWRAATSTRSARCSPRTRLRPGAVGRRQHDRRAALVHRPVDAGRRWQPILHGPGRREFRCVPTTANHEPAIAVYVREPGAAVRGVRADVLRVAGGRIADIAVFGNENLPAVRSPPTLP